MNMSYVVVGDLVTSRCSSGDHACLAVLLIALVPARPVRASLHRLTIGVRESVVVQQRGTPLADGQVQLIDHDHE